jgi:glycosyltransferase involved in cell wall biosynthesis
MQVLHHLFPANHLEAHSTHRLSVRRPAINTHAPSGACPSDIVRSAPTLSIILPTYNRAKFLPQAIDSIRAQTWTDWELIVVDDGSTDDTRSLVERLGASLSRPPRYVRQENQGAYGARNTGLDLSQGRYVAFFDSDDVWLPHHLYDCAMALEANPEVDWVYGACRVVDYTTSRVLAPNTFYVDGQARPFLRLRSRDAGRLRIIDSSEAIYCMMLEGLYCGLQNSVIRRRMFEGQRFQTAYRNEAEDQLVVVRALAAGRRLAYFDNVHVIYHEHDQNSSAAGSNRSVEKHLAIYQAVVRGFEDLADELTLNPADRRALRRRLGQEYFWHLGYTLLWQHGRREDGLAMYARGLRYWPWDWRCWKTYVLAILRTWLASGGSTRARRLNPCELSDDRVGGKP